MITHQTLRRNVIINGTGPYDFPFDIQSPEQIELHVDNTMVVPHTVDLLAKMVSITASDASRHAGKTLSILLNIPLTQELNLKEDSRWTPGSAEKALDKLQLQNQQLAEKVERALTVSPGDPIPEPGGVSNLLHQMEDLSASAQRSAQSAESSKASAYALASVTATAKNDTLIAKNAVEAMKVEFTNDFNLYRNELSQIRYLSAAMADVTTWRKMADQPDVTQTILFNGYLVDDETQSEYESKEIGRFLSDSVVSGKISKGRKLALTLVLPTNNGIGYYLRVDWVNVFGSTIQTLVSKQFTKTYAETVFTFETILEADFIPSTSGRLGVILTAIPSQMAKVTFAVGGEAQSPVTLEIADLNAIAVQVGKDAQDTTNARDALLNITAGQTTTLEPGMQAVVTVDKTNPAYPKLNFAIPKGEQGLAGTDGLNGAKGDPGERGTQGEKGDKGDMGVQGIQGIPGAKGDTGLQGSKGDKGEPGIKGDQGIQGIQGAKGDTGLQGVPGAKGDKGDPGTTDFNALANKPSTFTPSAHTQAISTVTGLQTALDSKIATSAKGIANGVASLDANAKIPMSQIPASAGGGGACKVYASLQELYETELKPENSIYSLLEIARKLNAKGGGTLICNPYFEGFGLSPSYGFNFETLVVNVRQKADGEPESGGSQMYGGPRLGVAEMIGENDRTSCVIYDNDLWPHKWKEPKAISTPERIVVDGRSFSFQEDNKLYSITAVGDEIQILPNVSQNTPFTFMLELILPQDSTSPVNFNSIYWTGSDELTTTPPVLASGKTHLFVFTSTANGYAVGTYLGGKNL